MLTIEITDGQKINSTKKPQEINLAVFLFQYPYCS